MAVYKFSNAGGFATYTRYNDFLAGNTATPLVTDLGSMYPLGVFTLASSQATVEFTNIPQTYTHLQIRITSRRTSANANDEQTYIQFNGDTASNYSHHLLYGTGTAVAALAGTNTSFMAFYETPGATSNGFNGAIIDILDYKNTNKNTTIRVLAGFDNNGTANSVALGSGLWRNTAAVNAIKLYPSLGDWGQHSSFALYGVQA